MKYAFLSVLAICLTVIYCTWRIEKMQTRRTMAAMQLVMNRGSN